jgi:hypothetical protein
MELCYKIVYGCNSLHILVMVDTTTIHIMTLLLTTLLISEQCSASSRAIQLASLKINISRRTRTSAGCGPSPRTPRLGPLPRFPTSLQTPTLEALRSWPQVYSKGPSTCIGSKYRGLLRMDQTSDTGSQKSLRTGSSGRKNF